MYFETSLIAPTIVLSVVSSEPSVRFYLLSFKESRAAETALFVSSNV
jgi:hypothetical protein